MRTEVDFNKKFFVGELNIRNRKITVKLDPVRSISEPQQKIEWSTLIYGGGI